MGCNTGRRMGKDDLSIYPTCKLRGEVVLGDQKAGSCLFGVLFGGGGRAGSWILHVCALKLFLKLLKVWGIRGMYE